MYVILSEQLFLFNIASVGSILFNIHHLSFRLFFYISFILLFFPNTKTILKIGPWIINSIILLVILAIGYSGVIELPSFGERGWDLIIIPIFTIIYFILIKVFNFLYKKYNNNQTIKYINIKINKKKILLWVHWVAGILAVLTSLSYLGRYYEIGGLFEKLSGGLFGVIYDLNLFRLFLLTSLILLFLPNIKSILKIGPWVLLLIMSLIILFFNWFLIEILNSDQIFTAYMLLVLSIIYIFLDSIGDYHPNNNSLKKFK
jgi:hypothetical protein